MSRGRGLRPSSGRDTVETRAATAARGGPHSFSEGDEDLDDFEAACGRASALPRAPVRADAPARPAPAPAGSAFPPSPSAGRAFFFLTSSPLGLLSPPPAFP